MQPGPGCGLPGAKAKQEAVFAPFVQVQSHGPLPAPFWSVTAEAIAPAAHSMLAGGGALVVVPLAEPHTLVVPPVFGAEQEAVLPPAAAGAQVQFQGPLPVTAEAAPASQRLAVGAALTATPLADPQAPLMPGAWQEAVVPPLRPTHAHTHGTPLA